LKNLLNTSALLLFLVCNFILQSESTFAQTRPKTVQKSSKVGRDTLYVNISNNEKIEIKRKIIGNTKTIIDKKVHEFRSYRIEFTNPKKVSLKLKVEDLLPSTKDPQVELEILESSDAEIDFTRGRLAWNFRLRPKEKKVLEVKYNVIYPKNKVIISIENVLQLQANIRKAV
jgi:AAA15 family ATPase/GTPase